jgi:uncharacterized protein (DUF952 family)
MHITSLDKWESAVRAGAYSGDTLHSEGFIHFSTPAQVVRTANRFFSGQEGLVLLRVDPARLEATLRYEDPGEGEEFPHLFGPLNLDAVVEVIPFAPGADGTFVSPHPLCG